MFAVRIPGAHRRHRRYAENSLAKRFGANRWGATVRLRCLCVLAVAVVATVAPLLVAAPVQADPGVLVFPGMEIRQDTNVCTLGYVDPQHRIAFTAGHCRGSGPVTDKDGRVIGMQALFRDNTPDGATVATDHQITDWEAIGLAPDVALNNILPGGRSLVTDPAIVIQPGQPICHFGMITGESCGTVEAVNNGWFTMANGIVSQKGDSGGPVYVLTPDDRAVLVGLFNSTLGNFPAAVSWTATGKQVRDDVIASVSANPGMADVIAAASATPGVPPPPA